MSIEILNPHPSSFIHSLRSVGYSLETAVADIIDNSISADASKIDIFFEITSDGPVLIITDNGKGMTLQELKEAMRLGSLSPLESRKHYDLGRFGLGMKTASFALCRRLTVISTLEGFAAAQWDLDQIQETNSWNLNLLPENEIPHFSFFNLSTDCGTTIIWEKIDRLVDKDCSNPRKELDAKMALLEKHLALTFHRYLNGERGLNKIQIRINGHPLTGFDPFNLKNPATQELSKDEIDINGAKVSIVPYILPHHSKTKGDEYEKYAGDGGYLTNQGFYVYRNKRLIVHGSWFRLAASENLTKLARVRIDIPNNMDEDWNIDVKKSVATPPALIRSRLKDIIEKIRDKSAKTYRARGRKIFDKDVIQMWEKNVYQGKFCYKINMEHPLIQKIRKNISAECETDFILLMDMLSKCFPTDLLFHDYAASPKDIVQNEINVEELIDVSKKLVHDWVNKDGLTQNEALMRLSEITPFNKYWAEISHAFNKG